MQSGLELLTSLPKVEIHNHLEGTISPETFFKLSKKHQLEGFSDSLEKCNSNYNYTDFQGFLQAFAWVNSSIQEISDFRIIINDYLERIKNENYKYVEFFLSVDTFLKKGFSLPAILDKVKEEFKRFSTNKFIVGGIIIDFVRSYGPKNAEHVFSELKPILDDYKDFVLGVSIGGDEKNYPAPLFKSLFDEAKLLGLHTTAHAGEVMDAKSIWDTIMTLKTDRIGHGINSINSNDLLRHLKATQTPLEICPTSNIKTGSVSPPMKNHPIRRLYDAGVNVTINTDDSGFFSTSLSNELHICQQKFGFTIDEIKQMTIQACKASFLPQMDKLELVSNTAIELDRFY